MDQKDDVGERIALVLKGRKENAVEVNALFTMLTDLSGQKAY